MILWERVFRQILNFSKQSFSLEPNALLKSWFKFWHYVDIQYTLWHEVINLFESLRRCKKKWFKIWFFSNFSIQSMFFSKNIALRSKLFKKVGKLQIWHFNNVNWQRSKSYYIVCSWTRKVWGTEFPRPWTNNIVTVLVNVKSFLPITFTRSPLRLLRHAIKARY